MNYTNTDKSETISLYFLIAFATLVISSIVIISIPERIIKCCKKKKNKIHNLKNDITYHNPHYFYTEIYFEKFNNKCAICCQDFHKKDIIYKTDCGHYYHKNCILTHFNNSYNCPLCRKFVYETYNVNLI